MHSMGVVTHFARNEARKDTSGVARHWWTTALEDSAARESIAALKHHPAVISAIRQRWPQRKVFSVEDGDEVYYAVSPSGAKGGDRVLGDCHFDAPFGWLPDIGAAYVQVILSCTRHGSVETTIEGTSVHMSFGDFHGIDSNADFHCADGSIAPHEDRVLLKLHYIVADDGANEDSIPFQLSRALLVGWTKVSREMMRASTNPKTPW